MILQSDNGREFVNKIIEDLKETMSKPRHTKYVDNMDEDK
jgi:hypothetical protein